VQDESDENRFYAFESYTDLAAMQAHMHGAVAGRMMEQIAPMLAAPPVKLGGGFDVYPSDNP
jgi:quinol monooxygenase YgiN